MKKQLFYAIAAAAAFVSCSTDDVVNEAAAGKMGETPIGFNVQKENITRAQNLETQKHYNFGVWAWKVNAKSGTELSNAEVMNHYLVGWSNGTNLGYDNSKATTYATTPGSNLNHLSPWFYEGLGTDEYTFNTASTGFYYVNNYESTKPMAWVDYKSVNENQYLRYWDLAYTNTNFYAYAPYNAKVTFEFKKEGNDKGTATMTFPAGTTIRDGYDEPRNHAYDAYSRTLGEFMYAGVQATNAKLADVTIPFKHMGAQLFIRFYEDIPGYKVEIIDLDEDHGTLASGVTAGDGTKGIQAAPAVETTAPVRIADQDEADTYNAGLTGAGAVHAGDEKTPVVYYTQEECNEHNATLTGAVHLGDLKTPTTYYTQEDVQNGTCTAEQVGQVKTAATYWTSISDVNVHNANLEGAWTINTVKTAATTYTADEAKAYNRELPGAKKVGDIKTPGVYTKENSGYYTKQGATVTYTTTAEATYTPSWSGTKEKTPLMFLIPEAGKTTADNAPANLTAFGTRYVIQEKVIDGDQKYSYSPTIYYPVAQPIEENSVVNKSGLTFHVSYRIIAEDNKEVITVHNATVHVPYTGKAKIGNATAETDGNLITVWQPNVKYTYTFKITRNSNGTTNPATTIDPTSPSVDDTVSLYPIVFDNATIEDYTDNASEYSISEGTNYNQQTQTNP